MSVGRRFSVGGTTTFEIRAEFFNVFNRTYLGLGTNNTNSAINSNSTNNALATRTFNALGEPTGGFGYINPTAAPPHSRGADRSSRGSSSDSGRRRSPASCRRAFTLHARIIFRLDRSLSAA